MLNFIWLGFFATSFVSCLYYWLVRGETIIFADVIKAMFDMASFSVEIALGLIGLLCMWMGFFSIVEKSGLITLLSKFLTPLFNRLMPEVPANHPAIGSVTLNLAANALGLDNAATPLGLKAMQDLQSLNKQQDTASNAQILFLVMNTSSVTILPVTIFLFRAQQGSPEPTSVFIPILLATSASTLAGFISVAYLQRLSIFNRVVGLYFVALAVLIASLIFYLNHLPKEKITDQSNFLGNFILFLTIIFFLGYGWYKKVNLYEAFVTGAKLGFATAIKIIPYLVAMLVAIGVLRASHVLDGIISVLADMLQYLGIDTQFVHALPTAIMRPFSGSGSRAMWLETMNTYGVDSFAAKTAAVIQGSTETTFYVLAVYFGSVGIKRVRHAIGCGLIADVAGITAAILVSYWFFS